MANELDEVTGPTAAEGRDVAVIARQIPAQVGVGSGIFEIALWTVGTIPGIILLATGAGPTLQAIGLAVGGLLPGLIFLFLKINALTYLRQLQQRIQALLMA